MKKLTNLFLMIALLGTIALADGEMGNGNSGTSGCSENCPPPPPPCVENCPDSIVNSVAPTSISSKVIIILAKKYLGLS